MIKIRRVDNLFPTLNIVSLAKLVYNLIPHRGKERKSIVTLALHVTNRRTLGFKTPLPGRGGESMSTPFNPLFYVCTASFLLNEYQLDWLSPSIRERKTTVEVFLFNLQFNKRVSNTHDILRPFRILCTTLLSLTYSRLIKNQLFINFSNKKSEI